MSASAPPTLLTKITALAKRAGIDGFIVAIIVVVMLAYSWPTAGSDNGPLPLSAIATYGASFIFFFYGLRLNPEKLRAGLSNWRLHLVVHLATFVVFPLLILAMRWFFASSDNELLWIGIFYLAALPSTVSSSVVMVSIAEGNIPAAIFNASISSLLGVFITPVWMSLLLNDASHTFDLGSIMGKLALQVVLPVVLGVLLHARWGAFAEKYRQQLRYFDQSVILLIVYTSFCESFAKRMFQDYNTWDLFLLSISMIGLFLLVYFLINSLSRLLRFNREDRITAVFCGSKKSLVHGTVMSNVLFAGSTSIGIVLLPLMLYHALQLITASMIAQALAKHKYQADHISTPT